MVNEKHNGNLLVHLGAKLQAYPEELLRQRRGHDGQPEYLIQWSIVSLEERAAGGSSGSSAETKPENISMWMSAEEVCASCPALLGKRRLEGQWAKEEKAASPFAADVPLDEASLLEMKADVRSLVQRAGRQMAESGAPESSILNTIHVLSAYASIGSLAGAFKETGALDLLMKMLCHKEKQIRRSAGKMLRALASHDAGSWAYVLLSLSQQDDIEQHMDFDSRYTLLELFAETTSSEEHCVSFEGIHLPQVIPGKLLFILVKRYLCVTSLMDKLSSGVEQEDCAVPSLPTEERSRVRQEFEFSMAMANLILELVHVMGWDHSHKPELLPQQELRPHTTHSIFQHRATSYTAAQAAPAPPPKEPSIFKTRSAFPSRSSYVEYVQANLVRGMRVRMLEDYEQVSAGDEGDFRQSNDGTPPVQVYWQALGCTYWVHWHMVEIIGPSGQEEPEVPMSPFLGARGVFAQPFFCKPSGGLYSLPYLGEQPRKAAEALSRAEWWELLFFVKKLEAQEQKEIACLIQQAQGEQRELCREALIQLSVPAELAQKVLQVLEKRCQGSTRRDLCGSHVYAKYFLSRGADRGRCPPAHMQVLTGVLGHRDVRGQRSTRLGTGRSRGSQSLWDAGPPGGTGVPVALLSECSGLSGPPLPLRILNKFLDAYQEGVLPWHECVEPCLSSLSAHSSDREVVQEAVGFLHRLATASKDCAVAMCRAGAREALSKALDKHSTALSLAPALLDLVTDCEKYASLYKKLTTSILSGCIQLVLGQIEEHRRSHRPISIPFFDVFLHNLCRGSSVEVKEDKCWEKVQVSSNPHRASKLTDRNPKTYWESNGSTGSHFITVHMQCGVVVREMSMLVASEDSSYMPARVVVLGGDSPAAIRTELNSVTILPSDSRVILLENMTRFWPVIQIRVKRCQQGGIDTRVRGIEVLGPKPTFWPIFKEQLCRRTFLSCTAQAHAWCQEICRDRGQLLQLFGRLNRALRHEQGFADRFLPDDEAARALGRTCWEALVTPLVQSITSPDPQGVSPLAWLLSEYLERVELPRHALSRGTAFGSRVRRLTQLLVHVDPGSPEPEEARAAGDGLWGISRCWRGVVQQQVWRFLEAAGQAPDLVERYCRLYQRLRGATEELFGQRAAFVLALGQGFAGALLQLPFLAALHVSEQFARYLDGQVQELHGTAGSAEPLQRLQQILEPFVVFSGLELAHTFEHFYRHYLGDRLLAQGPSWLEGAVVEQIGLCFPSRFPQEMLSNLAESEELQRQFYLFQLQEQDRRLLELDVGLDEVRALLGGGREEAGGCPHSSQGSWGLSLAALASTCPEVKVLALSPRCWPVSPFCYMDEPRRFFSGPRRLQWTWLGHAELHFGDCVLHVSTLQMYILLRFNSVAVEALLQATGLPAELLHHALTPLTQGEGVLVRNCAPGGERGAALARASGRHLRLLPRQRYLRAERAEVSALERKRNVLCCLITRILKVEKQLHTDNLVFRVIDACQKGELGPGLQFLSFCCHSVDVLSCVLHLLNQGYLRRQEERPHVLEYISAEPTTPPASQVQPQVAFQTVEIKMAASPAPAERRQTFSTFR
uniref:Cullin-9 n=1 Tax=Strix occidentalis caurina TaxID=311401 RepID=A0A8D0KZZ2_STROC